jgi:hypothetical protein
MFMKNLILMGLLLVLNACHSPQTPSQTSSNSSSTSETEVHRDTIATLVSKVQQQSRLYAADCKVHKVVLFTDQSQIDGGLLKFNKVGYRKIAIPIDVTLKGYIDFSDFSVNNVQREGDLLVITLPDPKVTITASKIDHQQARQFVSLTRSNFTTDEVTRLAHQGVDSIRSHANSFGIIELARASAARTLVPIAQRLGYAENNVVVRYRKEFNKSDWKQIVKPLNSDRS